MASPSDPSKDQGVSLALLKKIQSYQGPPINIMEVCGTHTVAIARIGLRGLLPQGVRLLSGPGCPVCVTPTEFFDMAIHLAKEGKTIATYGDALRVPGSRETLARVRDLGAKVVPVYSVMDAVKLASQNPSDEVVFLGLGFETTSPTVATGVLAAKKAGLKNFSVLCAHKALMPAMLALLADPNMRIGAFLCPGHASMVLGSDAYLPIAKNYKVPCVVAGFDPNDVLLGISMILDQAINGEAKVQNGYPRAVTPEGNPAALKALDRVFEIADSNWRGFGSMPLSGYAFRSEFEDFDAQARFLGGVSFEAVEPRGCSCAEILRGLKSPEDCPLFAKTCTAENPVGACMVSSEGACGAHYRYRGVGV